MSFNYCMAQTVEINTSNIEDNSDDIRNNSDDISDLESNLNFEIDCN